MFCALFVAAQIAAASQLPLPLPLPVAPPVRDIAFARDGRLAASIEGDIWVRSGSRWSRVTEGPEWDRQPAWSPDGSLLVFARNREGDDNLWRVNISGSTARGAAEQLTDNVEPDLQPAVAADGTILFVRGWRTQARLWTRSVAGEEKRVTTATATETSPVFAPDGRRFVYLYAADRTRSIRLRTLGDTKDSTVTSDRPADNLTWSPDGNRIAFSSGTPRGTIYVTTPSGDYINVVGLARGDIAWSPDGRSILVAERDFSVPGYNGDPDRVGDRDASETFSSSDRLVSLQAPSHIVVSPTAVGVAARISRRERNAEAFDRFAERMRNAYLASPEMSAQREQWSAIAAAVRPEALAATTDLALETVMHKLVGRRPALRPSAAGKAGVSSSHPVATAAGVEMLSKGGNVVDAAVAVSFALGVVEPDASGMGGYGEMLVLNRGMSEPTLIEFMSRVPEEGGLSNANLQPGGRYPSDGPMLAMVPGTVSAMHTAWKKYGSGKLAWADLIAPAIRAARDGYEVSDGFATTLRLERDRFAKYPSSKALFFNDGTPKVAGDTVKNADLAWTLEQVAKGGADGFYKGEVARRLVGDLRGKGNAIQLTDLSRYFATERAPVTTSYRGHQVYGSAPPASGGTLLAAQLNNLEQAGPLKPYFDDAPSLHAMIAAWQLTPSSRNRIADPALWPVDISPFVSKDTARIRWGCFNPKAALTPAMLSGDTLSCALSAAPAQGRNDLRDDRAQTSPLDPPDDGLTPDAIAPAERIDASDMCEQFHAEGVACRAQGTTSFVVADADGNAVAVTQTLGTWGGNFYVSPGLGFIYNDKLTSYSTDVNGYGARMPFARHGSSLSPALVTSGSGNDVRAVLAIGAAGNAWINSAVYQGIVGVLDFGLTPQQALEQPRFLPSQRASTRSGTNAAEREFVIDIEDGIGPEVLQRLEAMGHHFNKISLRGELRMGYGAAIGIRDGRVSVGADPRRSGTAGAIP